MKAIYDQTEYIVEETGEIIVGAKRLKRWREENGYCTRTIHREQEYEVSGNIKYVRVREFIKITGNQTKLKFKKEEKWKKRELKSHQ